MRDTASGPRRPAPFGPAEGQQWTVDVPVVTRRIAVVRQGGGSHTAFTGGVPARLLRAPELRELE
ncbi:hypothetical protein GCM10023175_71910 [Pseudonocardia xishanensis]|uniref:Uncharacterized protein n=1 Tax=Pseudonocardia xishanensis TaxID=630995 RepID=A0ABP8S3T8_9PSEU